MEIESGADLTDQTEAAPGSRPTGWERSVFVLSVVALVLMLRGRGNMVSCAFLPLFALLFMWIGSRRERARARELARRWWERLKAYPRGGPTPWAAVVVFVVYPAALLNLSNNHVNPIGDTSCVVPSAYSLLRAGNTDLDEFSRDGLWWAKRPDPRMLGRVSYFVRLRGEHLYPAHPSGMVSLALPGVALSRLAGARLDDPIVHLRLEKLIAAFLGALALGVFFLLALHLVRPAPAWATTAMLATASGMLTTVGQNLWQHDGVILGSLSLLLLEFRHPGRRAAIAQGVICGLLVACRLTSVTFLLPFGAWIFLRSPRRACALAVVAALAFAPWAAYYQGVYGSPLGPSTTQLNLANWSTRAASGRLVSVLVSPGRGLLIYQPWIVLASALLIPAVARAPSRDGPSAAPRGAISVCVGATVLEVLLVSAWHVWWGGDCWGSRLVVSVVPLCALLCARPIAALLATLPGRFILGVFLLLGLLVQVPGAYTNAFRWNFDHAAHLEEAQWSWTDAPFLAPWHAGRR